MRLKEMAAAKQAGGKGETEKGKQPAAQKKRTRTTRQSTQTQPLLLAADAPFAAALEAIPADDWCRTWAASRTIMLRRTSKRVKEVVDKMRLPAVVCLSRSFWADTRNGTAAEKLQSMMRQLPLMTAWCRISTLELPRCDMTGQDAESLAGVLWNDIKAAGAESLSGVLAQCTALARLDLGGNGNGAGGAGQLTEVLPQCMALKTLILADNDVLPRSSRQCHRHCRGREAARFVAWSNPFPFFQHTGNKKGRHIVHMQRGSLRPCTFALS
jgi:hypothetical protein